MFSRFRRSKSEKPVVPEDVTSDLRGMPALKQRRSERREESLHSMMSSLSETDNTRNNNGSQIHAVEEEPIFGEINIPRNYKRPLSPGSIENRDARQSNYVDRVVNGRGSHFVFDDEKVNGADENVFVEHDDEEQPSINTSWRMSKGDSGYKSKDEELKETNNNNKRKSKKPRKKSSEQEQSRASGLYTIKQQRKASRESGSPSMRALTPRERESIQCLEEVLKDHPLEGENVVEVIDSEFSDNDQLEEEFDQSTKQTTMEENEEAVDYGYASVNDMSRKYSLESLESVGSIIDLVGNLSSSPTSPAYTITDMSKKNQDVNKTDDDIRLRNGDDITTEVRDNIHHSDVQRPTNENADDYGTFAHDVIMQLDEVIQSFSIHTTDDEADPVEESYSREEKKREKRSKRLNSRDSNTDGEKEKKKRERRKTKDSDRDKERKERRKKKKEEKKTREGKDSREESLRRREERISKHVDEISALTQDMIKTAQQEQLQEEPVYAQVDKSRKKYDSKVIQNQETKTNNNAASSELIDPPSPFSNRLDTSKDEHNTERVTDFSTKQHGFGSFIHSDGPNASEVNTPNSFEPAAIKTNAEMNTGSQYQSNRKSWGQMEEKQASPSTPEKYTNFTCTSTPIASPNPSSYSPLQNNSNITKKSTGSGLRRPVSDASDYYVRVQPYMSKYLNRTPDKPHISQSILDDSSKGLKHVEVNSTKGKVLHVEPAKHLIQETKVPMSYNTPPISHVEPPKLRPKKPASDDVKPRHVVSQSTKQPLPTTYNNRGRPMSLNLDESGNLVTLAEQKHNGIAVQPYSSFGKGLKPIEKPKSKPRPFVITSSKKPIQLY
uniref:reticulocyte-binding protein 2 homolog a-like n=1 Tax=Styela clava TaxID=7725 RepID=UPI00193A9AB5|nr:reticulocyte-binding protein 2 homolog a-like [Styela clava]